jgi:hypothetical protein
LTVTVCDDSPVSATPRVQIAPGIFVASAVRYDDWGPTLVYHVLGGVFDGMQFDSLGAVFDLVALLDLPVPA